jgi:condensin-2 complex subunit H2
MDTRFGHLLQPIRDLSQNWDIDIAAELESYLSELEQLVVTFDCGATTMNFAEAALLIQGSACIYSRKVEYLYSLVYQALELMASKR